MTGLHSATEGPALDLTSGKPPRSMAASGHIHFWQGGSLWIGRGTGVSQWHTHHAHQIALALEGDFRFRSKADGRWTHFEAAIVPSHCAHAFALDGGTVAHLFAEPETTEGRMLSQRFVPRRITDLPQPQARACAEQLLDALRGGTDAAAMRAIGRTVLATLAGTTSTTYSGAAVDARVARALAYIRTHVRAPIQLADVAAAANLSPSRLRHLFVQETGTTFRAYLLWLRINIAIESAMAGASWTDAAHDAGFADSAHLSRTHKRMFGIEPTAIRQG